MSLNLALDPLLYLKRVCTNSTKTLMISLLVFSFSIVMMDNNADASLSSHLRRLNNDNDPKWQPLYEQNFQEVSMTTLILPPPADFEFLYSFGIIGESNNTLSSEHHVYLKENAGSRPINITFTPSTAQLQMIWKTTNKMGFFQITNNFTETCDTSGNCILVTPEHYYMLKITGNNRTKTVIARDAYAFPQDEEYQKFRRIVEEIDRITVMSKENNETVPSDRTGLERGYL
jgi:hypothetical protein